MRKIIITAVLALALFSCAKKENGASLDELISSKNVKGLNEKKAALQSDMTKIEEALAILDVKKEEALVSVQTIKDTLFNHYLDI